METGDIWAKGYDILHPTHCLAREERPARDEDREGCWYLATRWSEDNDVYVVTASVEKPCRARAIWHRVFRECPLRETKKPDLQTAQAPEIGKRDTENMCAYSRQRA